MSGLELTASGARALAPSRVTPITLALRADVSWLLGAARGNAVTAPAELGEAAAVARSLARLGASFTAELAQDLGLSEAETLAALADGVARGLVTADGFQSLRALLGRAKAPALPIPRASLRRGLSGRGRSGGRWALMPDAAHCSGAADRESLAEAVAEQLLARWGVVCRDVFAQERCALPWREVAWALRRLEDRGRVRGGRFVGGFVGEQYALPDAVDMLRAIRREPAAGHCVRLSACDPLNLSGTLLPGIRIPALPSRTIELRDGLLAQEDEVREEDDSEEPAIASGGLR